MNIYYIDDINKISMKWLIENMQDDTFNLYDSLKS